MIIKETQFKELLGHLVKEIMTELASSSDPVDSMSQSSPDNASSPVTPIDIATQRKVARDKKDATRKALKLSKQEYAQGIDQAKADEKRTELNKRTKLPKLKQQIQALQRQQSLQSP
jgi:hypothetical protein